MEREPILSTTPPPGASQPLLTSITTITDGNENKEGVGLRTLSRIPADSIPDNKDTDEPYFIQPAVVLPASGSIQADIIGRVSDDPETPVDYQPLTDYDKSAALYDFLASLGITRQQIDRAQIPKAALLKLYQQEFSYFSWLKWSSLDHAVEKHLQWPLLSPTDMGSGEPKKYDYRVRPHERSILLKTTWGLIKAYIVRGFVQGAETGLLEPVHYFIYAMLAYRLGELAKTGQSDFEEFQSVFSGSSQKGIDSLVRSLAGLEARWLKLILTAPLIFGILQGISKMRGARLVSANDIQKIADKINQHLAKLGGFWREGILEKVPLLSNLLSLGSQVRKLEQWVRWDGRLDPQSRKQAFELIRRVAWEGDKVTQLNALESLAKIAHGIGLKDLPRLQRAGYSAKDLATLLYIKAIALADLEELSQRRFAGKKILTSGKMMRVFAPLPRRLYASYLLWWLGQSTSWWTQRLPFALLKTVKLGLEALFLQKIVTSIIEAIHCPDKLGFQFGSGYQDWASDYTVECFTTRINIFRKMNANESIDSLISEIPQYYLRELTSLDLSFKYLTGEEAEKIIQAVIKQEATLQFLYLGENQLSTLPESLFNGLDQLTFGEGTFSELSQLTSLVLFENHLSILDKGVFTGLNLLTSLDLSNNQLSMLSEDMFSDLSQLQSLFLNGNYLNTTAIINSSFSMLPTLTELDITLNQISYLPQNFSAMLPVMLNSLSIGGNDCIPRILTREFMQYFPFRLFSLSFEFSHIIKISGGSFLDFSSLKILDFTFNSLNVLNEDVFDGLSQLTELYLGFNKLRLNEGMFSKLNQLSVLDLSANQLSNLSKGIFNGLSQLEIFYFDSNEINILNEGVFSGLNQLYDLELYNNKLSIIGEGAFSGLSQLEILQLGSNNINFLNRDVFFGLDQLNLLFLYSNNLNVLNDDVFSSLSQLGQLDLSGNNISIFSKGVLSGLSQLITLSLNDNKISIFSEGVFNRLSQLMILDLGNNQLNDIAIQNITKSLPYQLMYLDVSNNQIGNIGMNALADILPCSNFNESTIYFYDNPANDTSLALVVQQTTLKKICNDQRCHSNLPPSESCGVTTNPTTTQMTLGFESSAKGDEIKSDLQDTFFWPHADETPSFQPALVLSSVTPESTSSLLTPAAAGAAILGVVGLSILLYKNSTWIQAIATTSSNLFQRYWSGGKTEEAKTTSPASLSDRRYTLFQYLSTFSAQRVSTVTRTTDMTPY